jgi:hypothetical protein
LGSKSGALLTFIVLEFMAIAAGIAAFLSFCA